MLFGGTWPFKRKRVVDLVFAGFDQLLKLIGEVSVHGLDEDRVLSREGVIGNEVNLEGGTTTKALVTAREQASKGLELSAYVCHLVFLGVGAVSEGAIAALPSAAIGLFVGVHADVSLHGRSRSEFEVAHRTNQRPR